MYLQGDSASLNPPNGRSGNTFWRSERVLSSSISDVRRGSGSSRFDCRFLQNTGRRWIRKFQDQSGPRNSRRVFSAGLNAIEGHLPFAVWKRVPIPAQCLRETLQLKRKRRREVSRTIELARRLEFFSIACPILSPPACNKLRLIASQPYPVGFTLAVDRSHAASKRRCRLWNFLLRSTYETVHACNCPRKQSDNGVGHKLHESPSPSTPIGPVCHTQRD